MSFLRPREIYQVEHCLLGAEATVATPAPFDSMSLQLVIPWWVALQQSPPPLHQLPTTLRQSRGALQLAIRRSFKTTLTRGLTLGAHPKIAGSKPLQRLWETRHATAHPVEAG